MPGPYQIVTFDCYGTLIDWRRGIRDAFAQAARIHGQTLDLDRIIPAYMEAEPQVQAGPYRLYREVLSQVAQRVAARVGWSLPPQASTFLADSVSAWPPFGDTNPALERLAGAGIRLGILSNIDDDLLAATRKQFTVPFHLTVTAQAVGSYKPAYGHFRVAQRSIAGKRWLHVAQSYYHDVVPARALNISVAWINRHADTPTGEAQPDHEFSSLTGLADWALG